MAQRLTPLSSDGYVDSLKVLDRFLTEEEAALRGPIALDPRWRFHSPMQVDAGADMMRGATPSFHGMSFIPVHMTDGKTRLGQLQAARQATQDNLDRLDLAIAAQKNQLADWVGQLGEVAGHKLGDRTFDPAEQARLRRAAGAFFAIGDHYNETVSSAKKRTLGLKDRARSAEEQSERKDLELKALKGQPLTVEELRPAARSPRPRRTRRA